MAGRISFLDTLPPAVARLAGTNADVMARLQRAAAQGSDVLAREARAVAGGIPRFDGIDAPSPRQPDMSVGSEQWGSMSRSADANNPAKLRQKANIRPGGGQGPNPAGDLKRVAADNIEAARRARDAAPTSGQRAAQVAGAAGAAAGVGLMVTPTPLTETGNPADLRDDPVVPDFIDETMMGSKPADLMKPMGKPAAKPVAKPVAKPAPEPVDYSLEARKVIDKLNTMRRQAPSEVLRRYGGDIPEAPAMKREIDRLLALGDRQRNTRGYQIPQADPARGPYQQARVLLDQVNDLQARGIPHGDPRVQRLMAQVRQLHAQGDAIRNKGVYR